jgi:hypothetical protein
MNIWPSTDFTIETQLAPAEIECRLRPHVQPHTAGWFDVAPGDTDRFEGEFWDGGFQFRLIVLNARRGPGPEDPIWIATYDRGPTSTAVHVSSIGDWTVWWQFALAVIVLGVVVLVAFGTGVGQFAAIAALAILLYLDIARYVIANRNRVRARLERWVLPQA